MKFCLSFALRQSTNYYYLWKLLFCYGGAVRNPRVEMRSYLFSCVIARLLEFVFIICLVAKHCTAANFNHVYDSFKNYLQWNLSKADTIGTTKKCPLHGSVHFIESRTKKLFFSKEWTFSCIYEHSKKDRGKNAASTKCRTQDAGCRTQDAGRRMVKTIFRIWEKHQQSSLLLTSM